MRKIELVKGISSSVLGFGCAPILGAIGSKKAKAAIECAIEYGINHFDLARSYGYGEAEHFVGKIIKGKRDKLVLASKFGIKANWKAKLLRPVKPFVRSILDKKEQLYASKRKSIGNSGLNVANNFHDRILLTGKEMRNSLERSLDELHTEYLDYFFVHEPKEKLLHFEELALTAEVLKKEGKIRAWGLAYMRDQEKLHQSYLNQFDILQFNLSPGVPDYKKIFNERRQQPNVIFSPFNSGTNKMKPAEKLKKLFNEFQSSVILCSMFSENHIKDNALLASFESS